MITSDSDVDFSVSNTDGRLGCECCVNKPMETAVARCVDCNSRLCSLCHAAHMSMEYLKSHRVATESELGDTESMSSLSDLDQFYPTTSNLYVKQKEILVGIEAQINNTYDFYQATLDDKRNRVLEDLYSQFYTNAYSLESIQFVPNVAGMQASIETTFGYISLRGEAKPWSPDNTLVLDAETVVPNSEPEQSSPTSDCLTPVVAPKFRIYRLKMQLRFKFGGMGTDDAKFTEPNGLAFSANGDIIVADSNSNLIKVFDSNGYFHFKFGHGKVMFPNRVACHKPTGDIVVIERKPAHEIKVFSRSGEMLRRFGSGLLKSPRGICIDRNSRIVILESKVMRVLIFDMKGILLKFFDVSKHFRFANSLCTSNTRDEIFISDNHSHCIKVFGYDGRFLREIGGHGLTNYPTSVDINSNGELVVTDNYNSFNLTVLTQDGELVNAYESKLKHARILDVAIANNDSVIFSSRDNHIYMYNYSNVMF